MSVKKSLEKNLPLYFLYTMKNRDIDLLVQAFVKSNEFKDGIAVKHSSPEESYETESYPDSLHPLCAEIFKKAGIERLYRHQSEAIQAVIEGKNLIISTGTASGKSLSYTVPVLNSLLQSNQACSLLLFPTKALCHDQKVQLSHYLKIMKQLNKQSPEFGVYDGDTVRDERKRIRDNANIVLTNPDMFHIGILPNHTEWSRFFANLRFVVIDEVHIYRGIFGSHFTNLIRRLKRICRFYGSNPQFILCSATLSNISDFAEKLIEEPFCVIDKDYSTKGKRHFIIYNPPFVNQELGIRRSYLQESIRILRHFRDYGMQILLFARSRRTVELIFTQLERKEEDTEDIRTYRSGYLASTRRNTEMEMKNGNIRTVIATNALELGIDIGGVDIVIMCGYPGTIAATRQQSGRAGRRNKTALTIMITSSEPIEQYIASNPDYLFGRSPEQALIEPDNPYLLLSHLSSAVYELPFKRNESFGALSSEQLSYFMNLLQKMNKTKLSRDTYYWISDKYPAEEISLRTADPFQFALIFEGQIIGKLDRDSALWMTHPGAVYLQEGSIYIVENLDLEKGLVYLTEKDPGYYTEHMSKTDIELIELEKEWDFSSYKKYFGKIKVTKTITGFRKIHWTTHEILDYGKLELPSSTLMTKAYWFSVSPEIVTLLKADDTWFDDANDYGKDWEKIRQNVLQRDQFKCQACGKDEKNRLEIHHKTPFKMFKNKAQANDLSNLVTLCASCHREAEAMMKIQSALSGADYLLHHLAPLLLMCEKNDIGVHKEACAVYADQNPCILLYDTVPGGIGLSEKLYEEHLLLLKQAIETIHACQCSEGCPSCTGAVSENGWGAKKLVRFILEGLNGK